MPDEPRRVGLGYFFRAIQSAHKAGMTSAQTWGAIQEAAEAQGMEKPLGGIQAMNRLYSTAARAVGAARRFAAAADPNAITNDMITLLPNARDPQRRNEVRQYEAQVEIRHQVGDRVASRYVTIDMGSQLPPTVGAIREAAGTYAEQVASGGITGSDPLEGELIGVGEVQIWEG